MKEIKKIAVIGAGVMGAGIATQCIGGGRGIATIVEAV